ncbi:Nuclear pore complex protein NUP43 [Capsicum annuum]|nr:Nuclear pore complex protein NUP43 [Capsicum annuum]
MASSLQIHHFPQDYYIDSLRWLPQLSTFHHHIILASFHSDSSTCSLRLLNFTDENSTSNAPELTLQCSLTTPSRITSLKTSQNSSKPLVVAATFSGELLVYTADLVNGSLEFVDLVNGLGRVKGIDVSENGLEFVSVGEDGRVNWVGLDGGKLSKRKVFDSNGLVSYGAVKWASPVEFVSGGLGFGLQWWDQRRPGGPVSQFKANWVKGIDVSENGLEFVSVGEDGRINWVGLDGGKLSKRNVFDSNGLVSYGAVKWASPVEFVSGGLGFGLQWWDQRCPGGPVSQFKANWKRGTTSGIVHSIDIHPSRKHTCLAGGSSGTVFAWDLRWQQQAIMLSGVGTSDLSALSPSESDVWEVQYDNYTASSNYRNISESRVLPAMICSEDGILAVIEQGEEPIELLAEPCAINSFDINRQNPSIQFVSIRVSNKGQLGALKFSLCAGFAEGLHNQCVLYAPSFFAFQSVAVSMA